MENMTPLSRVEAILMGEPVSIPQSRVEYLLQELVDKLNELANSEIYEAKGSILFANLPTPSVSNDGWVYDVTDDFVTDSRFKTGAGQSYPGGTNVVIINDGTKENPVYKYDVLGGFINMDLYVQKEPGKGLSTNDYSNDEKTKLGGIAEGAEVNVQSDWNEADNSSDAYIQNKPTLGTASALDVATSGDAGDDEVVKGNDSRLSDDRNPTLHSHTVDQIIDFPTFGTAAGLNVPATGDASSFEVVKGDDSRVVNSPISGAISGDDISVTGTADANVQKLTVYGRSEVVEGEIVSIGDGGSLTITTTDGTASSTATLTTGLPLCGIPVNSGETYTDGDGQKWLADSVSMDGVVKRCYEVTFDGSEDEIINTTTGSVSGTGGSKVLRISLPYIATGTPTSDRTIGVYISTINKANSNDVWNAFTTISPSMSLAQSGQTISVRVDNISTISDLRTYLASNPVTIVYMLATPTTQELTHSEKSALLNLRTYDSTTNLSITDDPWADFGYIKNTANGKAVEQAAENVKKQVINDAAASNATTFSSNKIIDLISGQPKDYEIYTFRIDHDNSDPDTSVRPFIHGYGCDNYDYQNAGMDYTNDVFKYGDWANAFFIKNLKPVYLNRDGSIEYELDKNNYKQKTDGTTASEVTDLTSTGNVMIGFPTVWFFRYMSGSYEYVVVSNKQLDYRFKAWAHHDKNGNVLPYIYLSAYNGSLSDYDSEVGVSTGKLRSISGVDYHNLNTITNNKILSNASRGEEINFAIRNNDAGETGEGWYILHKAEWDMINDLLILISGTTDTQTAFGNGVIGGHVSETNTGIKSTGLYDDKGLFYGKNTQTDQIKIFGIEAWWGNIWNSLAGWINASGTQKVKMTHGMEDGSTTTGFDTTGSGYVAIAGSTPSGTSDGYVSGWKKTEYGYIPIVVSGSSNTFVPDTLLFNNLTTFAMISGRVGKTLKCGAFCVDLSSRVAYSDWFISARLVYKGTAA